MPPIQKVETATRIEFNSKCWKHNSHTIYNTSIESLKCFKRKEWLLQEWVENVRDHFLSENTYIILLKYIINIKWDITIYARVTSHHFTRDTCTQILLYEILKSFLVLFLEPPSSLLVNIYLSFELSSLMFFNLH